MTEIQTKMKSLPPFEDCDSRIPVTIIAKAKITPLFNAVKALGSQHALANALGISLTTLIRTLNCKNRPSKKMKDPEWCKLFFHVVGCFPQDVWPDDMSHDMLTKLSQPREFQTELRVSQLKETGLLNARRLELPDAGAIRHEISAYIEQGLCRLTERERTVIERLYGISDHQVFTYEALGRELGTCTQRIRQIEVNALRKLRRSSNPIKHAEELLHEDL